MVHSSTPTWRRRGQAARGAGGHGELRGRFRPPPRDAFRALHQRLGLEYFAIDCAELADGSILLFEADVGMIVHDLDPPDLYPYKKPQMRKLFDAFEGLLRHRAEVDVNHLGVRRILPAALLAAARGGGFRARRLTRLDLDTAEALPATSDSLGRRRRRPHLSRWDRPQPLRLRAGPAGRGGRLRLLHRLDISAAGYAAAEDRRSAVIDQLGSASPNAVYAGEIESLRRQLTALLGLDDLAGLQTVLAASAPTSPAEPPG